MSRKEEREGESACRHQDKMNFPRLTILCALTRANLEKVKVGESKDDVRCVNGKNHKNLDEFVTKISSFEK